MKSKTIDMAYGTLSVVPNDSVQINFGGQSVVGEIMLVRRFAYGTPPSVVVIDVSAAKQLAQALLEVAADMGPDTPAVDKPRRVCPFRDWKGGDIREGDRIVHPDGLSGKVVFQENCPITASDAWRADYGDGVLSRLLLQVGSTGRAVVDNEGKDPQ